MSCYRKFLQGTTKLRSRNATVKIMEHTLEHAKEFQEILGISWTKKDKRGKISVKVDKATNLTLCPRTTRVMAKRIQQDQKKN